ncbi:MAG: hypothetical protein JNG88_08790 [Phycisphaerales bacterium]|nr:hypothetical protein [Phycisphaerales bacterium]
MQERERTIVTGLVVLLLILALGFYIHRDPRFPGSLMGGVLGISAAALMLVPLAYLIVKRIPLLRRHITPAVSMRTLLAIHIYAGVLAPILGVLHSGHKFQSSLGIALTSMMIIVAVSGFVGRYLMSRFSKDVREQQQLLAGLRVAYERTAAELTKEPELAGRLRPLTGFFTRLAAPFFVPESGSLAEAPAAPARALRLSESIADLEYAIKTHEVFREAFRRWLPCHIVIAIVLYALLLLHIWSAWYFGIRWLT